jgi:hypothetical protein
VRGQELWRQDALLVSIRIMSTFLQVDMTAECRADSHATARELEAYWTRSMRLAAYLDGQPFSMELNLSFLQLGTRSDIPHAEEILNSPDYYKFGETMLLDPNDQHARRPHEALVVVCWVATDDDTSTLGMVATYRSQTIWEPSSSSCSSGGSQTRYTSTYASGCLTTPRSSWSTTWTR